MPEYFYAVRPGNPPPDYKNYAILLTKCSELESAFDLKGGFTSVAIKLAPEANERETSDAIEKKRQP